MDWREYQHEAAGFFETLGMRAEVEAEVVGARAMHNVDVAVTFTAYGIDHAWLVECKLWRRKVHKAEVLTLLGVVDDVGADRGFLLSESGFDPGAVTAARLTNITLTNLEDLRANAEADIEDLRWGQLYSQVIRCREIAVGLRVITDRKKQGRMLTATFVMKPGLDGDDLRFCEVNVNMVESGLEAVRRCRPPFPYGWNRASDRVQMARDGPAFFDAASKTLDECERWLRARLRSRGPTSHNQRADTFVAQHSWPAPPAEEAECLRLLKVARRPTGALCHTADVDRGDAEIGVPQAAPDDQRRCPIARHLDRVGIGQLMHTEPAAHASSSRDCAQPAAVPPGADRPPRVGPRSTRHSGTEQSRAGAHASIGHQRPVRKRHPERLLSSSPRPASHDRVGDDSQARAELDRGRGGRALSPNSGGADGRPRGAGSGQRCIGSDVL